LAEAEEKRIDKINELLTGTILKLEEHLKDHAATRLSGFKVKIPDIEIEFWADDEKEVIKRFDEVMIYFKEIIDEKKKKK
jgi:hypothetical protein